MTIDTIVNQAAFTAIVQALSALNPDNRVMVMEWVHDAYCPNCGYPAPPSDEDCSICKEASK